MSAGLDPEVVVSGEPEVGTEDLPTAEAVVALAARKGSAVAERLRAEGDTDVLVLACDSMLDLDGGSLGKASNAAEVTARWERMRGRTATLHTGHWLCHLPSGRTEAETDSTLVRFGHPTDTEIAAYAGTEESRRVAGPFTLEGRSAPWIEGIEGNFGTVIGVSLPVLHRLCRRLGVELLDLWSSA